MTVEAHVYVCDNHNCGGYGKMLLITAYDHPRCESCLIPLYQMPDDALVFPVEVVGIEMKRMALDLTRWKFADNAGVNSGTYTKAVGTLDLEPRGEMTLLLAARLCAGNGLDLNKMVEYRPELQMGRDQMGAL